MDFINNILSSFGGTGKDTVYMSITPSVGLELIVLDQTAKVVKNYAYKPLNYDETAREISDYDQFKTAVQDLFEELHINPKCNVVLNLPTVLFGSKEISLVVGNEGVSTAIISEVEQSYIFKRSEPLISWVESSSSSKQEVRTVFYTAIQKNAVDNIKNALSEIGAELVGIETSMTSLLRALEYTNLADTQLQDDVNWNLLVISPVGYSICSMSGKKLIEYYEEAIAVKSYEGEEIYKAISSNAQLTLMSYPANYLYIVSNTDSVSAEGLANKLPIDTNIQFLENNKFKKQEFLETSLEVIQDDVLSISLDAIGVAVSKLITSNLNFNLLGGDNTIGETQVDMNSPVKITFNDKEYQITPQMANIIAGIISAILIIPVLLLMVFVPIYTKKLEAKLQDIQSQVQSVEAQISSIENKNKGDSNFDPKAEVQKVLDSNRAKLMSFAALGESVPKHLWVTYFIAGGDNKVDIKGKAASVEDVYAFFNNMKDSLINVDLRLHKLEMETTNIDDVVASSSSVHPYYIFEITNMSDSDLLPGQLPVGQGAAPGATPSAPGAPAAQPSATPVTSPNVPSSPLQQGK